MNAAEIHARIGGAGWPALLEHFGVPAEALRNRHGPCPACGGKDRFRFDNKTGRGDFFCGQCGAGDGFALVMRVRKCDFAQARRDVMQAAGLSDENSLPDFRPAQSVPPEEPPAVPTKRVVRLLQSSCAIADCPDAVAYLTARGLWPWRAALALRAHASIGYWFDRQEVGRFSALLASVRDVGGQLVTAHVTYLEHGRKLATFEPRKILSPMRGRAGCAARLFAFTGGELGIAEGIETALAAARIHRLPVWAALNAGQLGKFEPPAGVTTLRIFADADDVGQLEAERLADRVAVRVAIHTLGEGAKDWNDELLRRAPTRSRTDGVAA